ncbi:putative zinc-finger domain-containing protein [Ditylenchus destructor]|uniref:Zinc-finger domain-containing protein n=1 Tax=Ditylenchus destructor TaxID=166010 RepID=A0AAD4N9C0_9BILA|nr:putative zinc-finger domain-containing protein [Ditylenchus destructor]
MSRSPIEEGEILEDQENDQQREVPKASMDNYDTIEMDVASDSSSDSASAQKTAPESQASVDMDDTDALRQMLLAQVLKRKTAVPSAESEAPKEIQLNTDICKKAEKNTVALEIQENIHRLAVRENSKSSDSSKISNSVRSSLKELSELQKDFSKLQRKMDETRRRKTRLLKSVEECDRSMISCQNQIYDLVISINRISQTLYDYQHEIEVEQSHLSKKYRQYERKAESYMNCTKGTQTVAQSSEPIISTSTSQIVPKPRKHQRNNTEAKETSVSGTKTTNSSAIARAPTSNIPNMHRRASKQPEIAKRPEVTKLPDALKPVESNKIPKISALNIASLESVPQPPTIPPVVSELEEATPPKKKRTQISDKEPQESGDSQRRQPAWKTNNISLDNLFPIFGLRSYKLDPSFPFDLITHPAFSNKIDPSIPLCPFQLRGRCADTECPWQHESDYRLTDEEIIMEYINSCPSLCPGGIEPGVYVKKLLETHSVEYIARYLANQIAKMTSNKNSGTVVIDV